MGREIKRVPLNFGWPLNKTWEGYFLPDFLHEKTCEACDGSGYSQEAGKWRDLWYGKRFFDPWSNDSRPVRWDDQEALDFARRNVEHAPQYYGTGDLAVRYEAERLAALWNKNMSAHLSQDDVDALVEAERLTIFTHDFVRGQGWVKKDLAPVVTAEQVNAWARGRGFGHDSINAWVVIRDRCRRAGVSATCEFCEGNGSVEAWKGQRDMAEAWTPIEPPTGEGWQVWETVSEGSPISPVFADREGLIGWLMSDEYRWGTSVPLTREQAERFVDAAWAPTMVMVDGEVKNGDTAV